MTKEDPGGPGGFPTPEPTVEYEPVRMDVDSVYAFGELLKTSARNMGNAAPAVVELMKDPEADQLGQYSGSPIGRDNRQARLHEIGLDHSIQTEQMTRLLDNIQTGIQNLGSLTHFVLSEFGGQDGLNEADIRDVDMAIQRREPNILGPQP